MATWRVKGKAVVSDPYAALEIDESGKLVAGTPRVLSLLSSVLEKSIQRNEKLLKGLKSKDVITIFHGSEAPGLSIKQYIERIFKYSKCSNSCFVVALVYIDRFLQRMDDCLTSLNVHRLLITSLMVAAKFMEDRFYNNAYYAKVGGVSREEMNGLEIRFLKDLDFRLYVTTEAFKMYCSKIEREGDVDYRTDRQIRGRVGGWPTKGETRRGPRIAGHRGRAL